MVVISCTSPSPSNTRNTSNMRKSRYTVSGVINVNIDVHNIPKPRIHFAEMIRIIHSPQLKESGSVREMCSEVYIVCICRGQSPQSGNVSIARDAGQCQHCPGNASIAQAAGQSWSLLIKRAQLTVRRVHARRLLLVSNSKVYSNSKTSHDCRG